MKVQLDTGRDTVWLAQKQMSTLFGKDVRTVNEHLQDVYSESELERDPTIRKSRTVRQESRRQVSREIEHYKLDIMISVGYRINSRRAVQFRQ